MPKQGEPSAPDGWFPFGSHAPYPWVGSMEFSDEKDDAGMPLWERPVQGEPTAVTPRCGNYAPHSAHTYREFQDDWPCPGAAATQEGEEK